MSDKMIQTNAHHTGSYSKMAEHKKKKREKIVYFLYIVNIDLNLGYFGLITASRIMDKGISVVWNG